MTSCDDFTMELLTNESILKMHTDSRHAHQVWRKEINGSEHVLWTSVSAEGGQYVAVFNIGEKDSEITIDFDELEIPYGKKEICELWSGESRIETSGFKTELQKHGAKAFLISAVR